ncbi:MGH1-like glycoside hydrolase domain-containing protein [Microbacterium deminutum]|uniref:Mannosylglycerate hydrolase MGH1-like glycoside hydrolase domain-containing protein n=1 Tax=Microbacterium deminutum TaxID=344164 RepID=A0ABP5C411_9MICO
MTERWMRLLQDFVRDHSAEMMREPSGILTHPYTVPSAPDSPYYSTTLWDWDSWFVSVVLGQVEADTGEPGRFAAYEEGVIRNFLAHTDADGVMPILLKPDGPMLHGDPSRAGGFSQNMHKPVIAQQAALLTRRKGSAEWIRDDLPVIERFLERYLESHVDAATGLAYWQTDFAVGVDNDPSVFYRPDRSCASIYLNSLLYRELLAYGSLLEDSGRASEANRWRGRAEDLADAVREHLWDERDGTFYSADLALRAIDEEDWLHSGAPRTWSSLLLRVDNWSSFLALWAGIATAEQAERMRERYLDRRTFRADYGVRTLSKLEKQYSLRASNNPSNWLGPVWGVSNYLVFRGLDKYGFADDARELAEETVALFGRDLDATGALHEFYHPDTGEPIMTKGFQNWNFLVLNLIAYLEGRPMVTEF